MPMIIGGVAAAAPIIGGILGANAASGDRSAAQTAYQNALAQYTSIGIPSVQAQQLALASPTVQGILNPQQQTAVTQAPNAMTAIQANPQLANAQMQALQTMQQTGQTGMTAVTQAQLDAANRQSNANVQAQANSITQGLAQRGAAGGGLELAAQLQNAQGGADLASQQSDRTMAMAQQNMLNATSQAGNLAGSMQQQQYAQADTTAQAQNAINQFNALQQAGVQSANVNAANQAQAANLANAQAVANQGVATQNAQQQYNQQLQQQYLQNELQLAGGVAGTSQQYGNEMNNLGNAVAGQYSGAGAGAGQMGMGIASMMNNTANTNTLANAYGSTGTSSLGSDSSPTSYTNSNYTLPTLGSSSSYAFGGQVGNNGPALAYSDGTDVNGVPSSTANNKTWLQNVADSWNGLSASDDAARELAEKRAQGLYLGGGVIDHNNTKDTNNYAYGGQTSAGMPGEYIPGGKHPSEAGETVPNFLACGGFMTELLKGGSVPGKAKVAGDSKKNDTVKAMLSPGEIVIPRSHAMTPHLAKAYIDHLYGKKK